MLIVLGYMFRLRRLGSDMKMKPVINFSIVDKPLCERYSTSFSRGSGFSTVQADKPYFISLVP